MWLQRIYLNQFLITRNIFAINRSNHNRQSSTFFRGQYSLGNSICNLNFQRRKKSLASISLIFKSKINYTHIIIRTNLSIWPIQSCTYIQHTISICRNTISFFCIYMRVIHRAIIRQFIHSLRPNLYTRQIRTISTILKSTSSPKFSIISRIKGIQAKQYFSAIVNATIISVIVIRV